MNRGLESGHKHVREDLLDLLYLVDFVERVFEVGICGIEIAQLRDSGFGDGFEVTNQVIETLTHNPVDFLMSLKYIPYGNRRRNLSCRVNAFGKSISKSPAS